MKTYACRVLVLIIVLKQWETPNLSKKDGEEPHTLVQIEPPSANFYHSLVPASLYNNFSAGCTFVVQQFIWKANFKFLVFYVRKNILSSRRIGYRQQRRLGHHGTASVGSGESSHISCIEVALIDQVDNIFSFTLKQKRRRITAAKHNLPPSVWGSLGACA